MIKGMLFFSFGLLFMGCPKILAMDEWRRIESHQQNQRIPYDMCDKCSMVTSVGCLACATKTTAVIAGPYFAFPCGCTTVICAAIAINDLRLGRAPLVVAMDRHED